MTPPKQQLFTLWAFGRLSWLEWLCLTSAARAGHPVMLFTYEKSIDAPDGVDVQDARVIVPEACIVRHQPSGSLALFSDIFRYEGIKKGAGVWIDADMLFLKDLAGLGEHVFGWQDYRTINGAVLGLPKDSPVIADIVSFYTRRLIVPPWWHWEQRARQRALALIGMAKPLERLPWGVIGPNAITYFVKANKLICDTQARDVFYPAHGAEVARAFDSDFDFEARFITGNTRAIHLHNALHADRKGTLPPAGSFLARQCERYGITTP